jgi:uncharacterized membrane protein YedE/YeeE
MKFLITLSLGFLFGAVLISSQVFHWYRIQEMFHFDSFHMFGVLGSAIATAAISIGLIKRYKLKSIAGNSIKPQAKKRKPFGNILGGLLFGIGWGLTGACTAPIIILLGLKWKIGLLLIAGALCGTLIFAIIKPKLPE